MNGVRGIVRVWQTPMIRSSNVSPTLQEQISDISRNEIRIDSGIGARDKERVMAEIVLSRSHGKYRLAASAAE
jgi:hypothetical protein